MPSQNVIFSAEEIEEIIKNYILSNFVGMENKVLTSTIQINPGMSGDIREPSSPSLQSITVYIK